MTIFVVNHWQYLYHDKNVDMCYFSPVIMMMMTTMMIVRNKLMMIERRKPSNLLVEL